MRYYKRHLPRLAFLLINAVIVFALASLVQRPTTEFTKDVQTNQNISTSPTGVVIGEETQNTDLFLVTRVIDGDTIQLENGQKVRYIGINTPETVDPRRGVQCFGKEASEKNKELVLNKKVQLDKDVSETDRFGRLLRYVYVDDVFVNNTLVREGFASASTYPPDVKYQEEFKQSEEEARNQNRGLWGKCKK